MQSAVLMDTLCLPVQGVIGANFAVAGWSRWRRRWRLRPACSPAGRRGSGGRGRCWALVGRDGGAAATLTTHSVAALDHRGRGRAASVPAPCTILGAAIWIGGIPCFRHGAGAASATGPRSAASARGSAACRMVGVGCILASGHRVQPPLRRRMERRSTAPPMASWWRPRSAMFGALLLLGLGNFLAGRAAAGRPRHVRAANAALRRGRDRHRLQHLLRRGLPDLRARRRST